MYLLLQNEAIIEVASKIEVGIFDEPFEKYALYDENNNLICYARMEHFTVSEEVELPDDFIPGKYFYKDGKLVLDTNWKPYVSPEERLENVEIAVSEQEDYNLALEEELLSTQLALTEQFEANLAMEDELLGTQLALTEQYEANLVLEEELLSTQLALTEMYEMLLALTEG